MNGANAYRSAAINERDPTKRRALNRLSELTLAEEQRKDRAAANFSPLFGPSSGINNSEVEYRNMLNRQGEIAKLEGALSGKPVGSAHSYAGTNWAEGGGTMPGGTPALDELRRRSFWTADRPPQAYDNLDRETRQAAIRQARAGTTQAEAAANDAVFARDPYRARAVGDINRSEADLNAKREAQTASDIYFSPEQGRLRDAEEIRQKRLAEDEARRQQELYRERYVTPQIVRGQTEIGKANITGQSRIGASALSALARSVGIDPMNPEAMARLQQGLDAIMPNVPGQGGGGQPVTPEELVQFGADNNMTPEQAYQYLIGRGYNVIGY